MCKGLLEESVKVDFGHSKRNFIQYPTPTASFAFNINWVVNESDPYIEPLSKDSPSL